MVPQCRRRAGLCRGFVGCEREGAPLRDGWEMPGLGEPNAAAERC